MTDAEVQDALEAIKVDPNVKRRSVGTFVHAVCLSLGDCKWVGHGHPESVLSILCSQSGAKPYLEHIFPDAIGTLGYFLVLITVCGIAGADAVQNWIKKHPAIAKFCPV